MLAALRSRLICWFLLIQLSILCWPLSADGADGNDKCNMLQSPELAVHPALETERASGSPAEGWGKPLEQLDTPSMFVAIVNARKASRSKRDTLRKMWQRVDGGKNYICTRHVFCKSGGDGLQSALDEEAATHGDMVFLDCAEGYFRGLLTRKVIAAMQLFRESKQDACVNRPLFMKIDEDTFVAKDFVQSFERAWHQHGENMYAGLLATSHLPSRDPKEDWYEPYSVFPGQCYPPGMVGGPGYILGRKTIDLFFEHKLVETVLNNEDRAVAYWVAQSQRLTPTPIQMVELDATNGYWFDYQVNSGLYWSEYPYVLVHKLTETKLSCLVEMDSRENLSDAVDDCFPDEEKIKRGESHAPQALYQTPSEKLCQAYDELPNPPKPK